jgi:dihydroorotate dehydrogenase (fumarate)
VPSSITRTSGRILRVFGVLALAVAAVTAPLLPATSASGAEEGDTISVAGRPAGADGRPDGRTRFSYAADPGQSVSDQFLVGNRGSERQNFTVYGTDAFNSADGSFALLATAEAPTAIGAWTRFENCENRIQFSLEPNEVRLVPFTVQLPPEATPGDHVGGLVASVVEEGQQVNVDRRIATPIYARVSGDLQPRLAVGDFTAEHVGEWWNPFGGTVKIRYTVENPGNIALGANVTMGVNTWFGIPAAQSQGGSIPDLLPGNSASYEFEMPAVGQWLYLNPHIRLNPFVSSEDPALQLPIGATTRDTLTWAVPWTVVIALLLAGGVVALVWWRRRREDERGRAWIEYTENEARAAAQREASLVPAGAKAHGDD